MEAGKINNRRTEWFENARFGLFIHWGLYAIPDGGFPDRVRA
jgi:alpha-L-fucosidase